jgi:hypothetical protein
MAPADISNNPPLLPDRDEVLLRSRILIIDDEEVNLRF